MEMLRFNNIYVNQVSLIKCTVELPEFLWFMYDEVYNKYFILVNQDFLEQYIASPDPRNVPVVWTDSVKPRLELLDPVVPSALPPHIIEKIIGNQFGCKRSSSTRDENLFCYVENIVKRYSGITKWMVLIDHLVTHMIYDYNAPLSKQVVDPDREIHENWTDMGGVTLHTLVGVSTLKKNRSYDSEPYRDNDLFTIFDN
ncbi:hypothetical protein QAD02_001444 [Eretmocerus hayati]|uniref:Uncharacterized protein n=1 Tax=Eretmocerus hayati TaxID=131215 RepID=A0ACC2NKU9_9HYME|nr:hypothetical protein QAD02_001444 [Eretmocerus hayati]